MKPAADIIPDRLQNKQTLPAWVLDNRGQDAAQWAFSAGAALAVLDGALRDDMNGSSLALWRDRLALEAARACLGLTGRIETASTIRDAVCLARQADGLGPAGEIFALWRALTRINLRAAGWPRRLAPVLPDVVYDPQTVPFCDIGTGSPVAQAQQVLSAALRNAPHDEAAALRCADVALARAMGWRYAVPVFARGVSSTDLRAIETQAADATLRSYRAIIKACDQALRLLADVSWRIDRFNRATGKLRAKGAAQAVSVFLTHDAVSASGMLSPVITGSRVAMSDRAARRLCDRLVDLGAVRELTGRSSFRLYGV